MTIDGHVVRRIYKDCVSLMALHEELVGLLIEGVTAINPMFTQKPQVARKPWWS
jgi:hypothetical protein